MVYPRFSKAVAGLAVARLNATVANPSITESASPVSKGDGPILVPRGPEQRSKRNKATTTLSLLVN